jgi:hypothetical protein
MKKIGIMLLLASILLTGGCKASQGTIQSPINQQSNIGFSITNEGFKWTDDKNALPFEETIKKAPFQVKQPVLPFEVTNKVAHAIKAPTKPSYDVIEMTYANAKQGLQLTLVEANSKADLKADLNPKTPLGPKLQNGSQTWIGGDQNKSGLYWRYDGVNYSMISYKIDNGKFVPLYDVAKLIEIANSIK